MTISASACCFGEAIRSAYAFFPRPGVTVATFAVQHLEHGRGLLLRLEIRLDHPRGLLRPAERRGFIKFTSCTEHSEGLDDFLIFRWSPVWWDFGRNSEASTLQLPRNFPVSLQCSPPPPTPPPPPASTTSIYSESRSQVLMLCISI